jgi:hypothetical protein
MSEMEFQRWGRTHGTSGESATLAVRTKLAPKCHSLRHIACPKWDEPEWGVMKACAGNYLPFGPEGITGTLGWIDE